MKEKRMMQGSNQRGRRERPDHGGRRAVRRPRPSERSSHKVREWLRWRRIHKGIRDVPYMTGEDFAPPQRRGR